MSLVLLLALACSGAPEPAAPALSAEPTATADPPAPLPAQATAVRTHPTPFTLAQMKAGWVPGVAVRFRMEVAGRPATLHDWEVLANPDPEHVETAFTVLSEDGQTVLDPRTPRVSSYEELRQHASFPASHSTVEQARIETPRGPLPGRRYRVRDADDPQKVQTFEFADAMPGPPVRMETRMGDTVVQSMVMLRRTDPG